MRGVFMCVWSMRAMRPRPAFAAAPRAVACGDHPGAGGVETLLPSCTTPRARWWRGLDRVDAERPAHPDRSRAPCCRPLPRSACRDRPALAAQAGCGSRPTHAAEVLPDGVRLADGRVLPAELVVAAGVKTPDFLTRLDGLETNPHQPANGCGRPCRLLVVVDKDIQRWATAPPARGRKDGWLFTRAGRAPSAGLAPVPSCSAASPASRCRTTATGTSGSRWCRWAFARWAT